MKSKFLKSIPQPIKTTFTIVTLGVLGYITYKQVKKQIDKAKLKKRLENYAASTMPVQYTTPSGAVVTQNINVSSAAAEIYDALYNNDWFGASEDEARAAAAVKTIPQPYNKNLQDEYSTLYSKDLKADLIKYLSADQWNSISYLFV